METNLEAIIFFPRIIISCLKPYNCVQTNDYHFTEIIILKQIITQKYPLLPNLRVLNSNLKSVFTHHLKTFFRYA